METLSAMARGVFFIVKIITRKSAKRMQKAINLFLSFPFSPPGYVFDRLPAPDGVYVEMLRFPVAEYFKMHKTYCLEHIRRNFRLASGGDLQHVDYRSKTLRLENPRRIQRRVRPFGQ